jgi:hypothetical protein
MGISVFPAAAGGMTTARFPAQTGAPFHIPAGTTLRNTVTSTTVFTAGQLPAQVWAVIVGGGGAGASSSSNDNNAGGGGGGVVIGWVDVPSAGITATIGAGGTAATQNGNRGGTTVFGGVYAHGGGGGNASGQNNYVTSTTRPIGNAGAPGWGGNQGNGLFSSTNSWYSIPGGAPFNTEGNFVTGSVGSSALTLIGATDVYVNHNYKGGGAGGTLNSSYGSRVGGNGLTGGGGGYTETGGNSSRDGGLTNSFTPGAKVSNVAGGGAGFIGNGSNGAPPNGGAGGAGGGGGGAGITGTNTGGAGGAGCVLIYY